MRASRWPEAVLPTGVLPTRTRDTYDDEAVKPNEDNARKEAQQG